MREQTMNSITSCSEKSSSSALQFEVKGGMDSDDGSSRVPEVGSDDQFFRSTSGIETGPSSGSDKINPSTEGSSRNRGRNSADKESRRLKRLLRNRVSAQQARERKKAYLGDLEVKVRDLDQKNSQLEERLSTLQNENNMLRQILKNTTVGRRGGNGGNTSYGEASM